MRKMTESADWSPLAEELVGSTYLRQGLAGAGSCDRKLKALLSSRRLPQEGWTEAEVEALLAKLAAMDSNNFPGIAGVGEREGRIFSGIVERRNFRMAHGIGRSGDVSAVQPKAGGSSLLTKICQYLVADAMREAELKSLSANLALLPVATGMTMSLTLRAIAQERRKQFGDKENHPAPTIVLISRIDQKTCLKAISAAGFKPEVIELLRENSNSGLTTNIQQLQRRLETVGDVHQIVAIVSTTSCFAPRLPDDIEAIGKLAMEYGIPHVINNAYGVQCKSLCRSIERAATVGRVDAVVQSMDKNFMVPVGGAIIVAPHNSAIPSAVAKLYPGRASIAPILDLTVTLLSMGAKTWRRLLSEREICFQYLKSELHRFAEEVNEKVLCTEKNPISLALTLTQLTVKEGREPELSPHRATKLGSMLFVRNVSGARTVVPGTKSEVAGIEFSSYGGHTEELEEPYLTAAAAIGSCKEDIDVFIRRLRNSFKDLRKSSS